MIYLKHITDAQELRIPKNDGEAKGLLTLTLKNTTDLEVTIDVVADINTSHLYFNLAVALPDNIRVGEYHYILKDDAIILSEGLLIVGDYDSKAQQYNTDITYEQYTD